MGCKNCEIESAKAFLRSILLVEDFAPWQPTRGLIRVAKAAGISRDAMKLARREMGVLSLTIDGEQHWCHPARIRG